MFILTMLRLFGAMFILASLGAFGYDAWTWLMSGTWGLSTVGEVWYDLSPDSIQLLQAFIQRFISPLLWERGFIPFLLFPLSFALGILGIGFLAIQALFR